MNGQARDIVLSVARKAEQNRLVKLQVKQLIIKGEIADLSRKYRVNIFKFKKRIFNKESWGESAMNFQ